MQKYGFDEARPLLERASARETAARVALGTVARSFLAELEVRIVSHTVSFGAVALPEDHAFPRPEDQDRLDADPVRCLDPEVSAAMVAEVDGAHKAGETLGGVVEVLAYGVPVGLGSHVHWDRRLDARLAGALMGIQAIKGVQVGDGFATAARRGSQAHDAIARRPRTGVGRCRPPPPRRPPGTGGHARRGSGATCPRGHPRARAGPRRRPPGAAPPPPPR